jgi:hypothetical protein
MLEILNNLRALIGVICLPAGIMLIIYQNEYKWGLIALAISAVALTTACLMPIG